MDDTRTASGALAGCVRIDGHVEPCDEVRLETGCRLDGADRSERAGFPAVADELRRTAQRFVDRHLAALEHDGCSS